MHVIDAVSPAARPRLVDEALSAAAALGPAGFTMSARAAAVPLAPDDAAALTIAALESALAMEGGVAAAEHEHAGMTLAPRGTAASTVWMPTPRRSVDGRCPTASRGLSRAPRR